MKSFSHLNSAAAILASYSGNQPFHLFIKKYFSANKKLGSKDRKQIASLCYNYFRLGHAAKNISVEEKILFGFFLCETQSSEFFKSLRPEWNDLIEKPLEKKLSIINHQFSIKNIFPFKDELGEGIDHNKFSLSFLVQPDLFLRIRPGNHKKVTGKLAGAGINYKVVLENCIALPNASKVDTVIELDKEAIVQDYNSQRVGEFISAVRRGLPQIRDRQSDRVWDCCAASGGKSIMAYDINPTIELTVSDKRASILDNLHKRFASSGIKNYKSFVADFSSPPPREGVWGRHDLIITDVPCTGSGTWARTPEQLFYFRKEQIEKYATLQKQIVQNVIPHLKKGGHLLYVTCSVYKKENEEIVAFIQEELHLQLIKNEILKGYEVKADTMFAALFTVPTV